jgi:hypothetical protein
MTADERASRMPARILRERRQSESAMRESMEHIAPSSWAGTCRLIELATARELKIYAYVHIAGFVGVTLADVQAYDREHATPYELRLAAESLDYRQELTERQSAKPSSGRWQTVARDLLRALRAEDDCYSGESPLVQPIRKSWEALPF